MISCAHLRCIGSPLPLSLNCVVLAQFRRLTSRESGILHGLARLRE